jgi:hypothetical protein
MHLSRRGIWRRESPWQWVELVSRGIHPLFTESVLSPVKHAKPTSENSPLPRVGFWGAFATAFGRFLPDHGQLFHNPVREGLPTIRSECELGLGCMYSSLFARFSALHTFQAFGNSEKPPRNKACGAPSRSSDLNGQGCPPLQGGEGDPKPRIRCDREWERFKRIKRRIISCAQLGSRTPERTRTNQEVYYQPTGAKTQ